MATLSRMIMETLTVGRIKSAAGLSVVALFLLTALSGCVSFKPDIEIPGRPDVLYLPGPKPGMTIESVKSDLSVLLDANYLKRAVWLLRPHNDSMKSVNNYGEFFVTFDGLVFDTNRIEFLKGQQVLFVLMYEDLVDSDIFVKWESAHAYSEFTIVVSGLAGSFHATSLSASKRFADALFFLQQEEKKNSIKRYGQTAEFDAEAAKYRASVVKPSVTEEQRKSIVQANALGQQKDYSGALERYGRVIEINPVAYPEAWFNMALLSAQQGLYRSAIGYMKRYLLLVPDAKDARAAQDKVYEWEVLKEKRK